MKRTRDSHDQNHISFIMGPYNFLLALWSKKKAPTILYNPLAISGPHRSDHQSKYIMKFQITKQKKTKNNQELYTEREPKWSATTAAIDNSSADHYQISSTIDLATNY
ncbi:hypothetical protein F8388_003700 [Cannabis sativa]|uniref:Uncharacterized protein n=1 Tax=Cannabis sativa TaxID=3483 RepID=A0A7J6F6Y2_CANSA|nr:hypothetical protein F8388_003700 [Cannabis sativa]KAF4400910.1 hypothetical protein G4B88_013751 [Cannabis sativa]